MPGSRPRTCQASKDFWRTLPAPPVTSGASAVIGCPTFLQLFRGRRQRRTAVSLHPLKEGPRVVANSADAWSIMAYELDPALAGLAHPFRRRAGRLAARSRGGCTGRTSVEPSAGLHRSRDAACKRLSAA